MAPTEPAAAPPTPAAADPAAGDAAVDADTAPGAAAGGGVTADAAPALADGDDGPSLSAALEAVLLVVDQPVGTDVLAAAVQYPVPAVAAALAGLARDYAVAGRGFELREVGGGWRYYTRADCADAVERFVRDGQQARLTQAALETLAVVAYKQPVSRARVSAVRGVNCDGVVRTLLTRGLIEEAGTDPGSGAVLYRTTGYFLERLGLTTLDELPDLAPYLPELPALDEEPEWAGE